MRGFAVGRHCLAVGKAGAEGDLDAVHLPHVGSVGAIEGCVTQVTVERENRCSDSSRNRQKVLLVHLFVYRPREEDPEDEPLLFTVAEVPRLSGVNALRLDAGPGRTRLRLGQSGRRRARFGGAVEWPADSVQVRRRSQAHVACRSVAQERELGIRLSLGS